LPDPPGPIPQLLFALEGFYMKITSFLHPACYFLHFFGEYKLFTVQITGNKITLEAWINVSEFKSQPFAGSVIVKDQGGIDAGYMIRCGGNGIINFNLGTGTWQEINSPANSVQLNNWHHVAATYDGTKMKIYVDGIVVAEANRPGLNIANAVSENLFIGESPGFPGRVFNGKIDDPCKKRTTSNPIQTGNIGVSFTRKPFVIPHVD
jgi:hypothetical protein